MKNSKAFSLAVRVIAVVVLALGTVAVAHTQRHTKLRGVLNDYTGATGIGGPWEMHGQWSLDLNVDSGKADFSVVMTMEHPDSWIAANPGTSAAPNVDNPVSRNPHTHHITMMDALVTYDLTVCPANSPATTSAGFVLTGAVSITGNGNPAPFEAKGPSTLQICVTGGAEVPFSNVSLVLTGPATGHFGSHAINGVVRFVRSSDELDDDKHDGDGHDGDDHHGH
jgi:hypothetical protein